MWLLPAASMGNRCVQAVGESPDSNFCHSAHTCLADNREFIDTRLDAFFCRKITGGNLQVRRLPPPCVPRLGMPASPAAVP